MPIKNSRGSHAGRRQVHWDQQADELANYLIKLFGRAAAGKALDMVRVETSAGNRDEALRWHHVMTLIEKAARSSR
jgi:hypothetical protein